MPIRKHTPIKKSGPNLICAPNNILFLETLHTDVCTLANNHTGDFGEGAVIDTLKLLDTHSIRYCGAGGISTVDDYIKFLEALRTHKLLKSETLKLMMTDRLTEWQKRTYWMQATHGYGLGVRCPKGDKQYTDFGWGGAACAYLAVDLENKISLYFGAHLLSSPAQGLRSMLYRFIRAELIDRGELDSLYKDLKELHNYNLTY